MEKKSKLRKHFGSLFFIQKKANQVILRDYGFKYDRQFSTMAKFIEN